METRLRLTRNQSGLPTRARTARKDLPSGGSALLLQLGNGLPHGTVTDNCHRLIF